MKAENFEYWLQGFFEISESNSLTANQTALIKKHLELVTETSVFIETIRDFLSLNFGALGEASTKEIRTMLSAQFTEETKGKTKQGSSLLRSC